jgi:hypothetical protein
MIDIDAQPARVFSLINDSVSLKEWIPNLIENGATKSTDDGVGSTFHQVYTTLLKPLVSNASQKQQGDQFAKLKALAESGESPPAAD